ncbi:helix-turn-helix domain-containing protein [Escherichia coli]
MKCAYKYRFYPTPELAEPLSLTFGCARFVYNASSSSAQMHTDIYIHGTEKETEFS